MKFDKLCESVLTENKSELKRARKEAIEIANILNSELEADYFDDNVMTDSDITVTDVKYHGKTYGGNDDILIEFSIDIYDAASYSKKELKQFVENMNTILNQEDLYPQIEMMTLNKNTGVLKFYANVGD